MGCKVCVKIGLKHKPCRLGTGKRERVFAKGGVVLSDSRELLTGVAQVIFTEVDVDVAQHIAVPERAFFALLDENSVAVLINCHKRPQLVAKLAFGGIIKIKACIIDNNIPVLAAAVWTEVCNAFKFFAVFRKVVFHSYVHFKVRINCS